MHMIQPRAGRTKRGRAVVACGLLAFAVLQVAGGEVIDRCCPSLRDPEYNRKLAALRAQAAAHHGRPLLLALGTSRTAFGFCAAADGAATAWQFNFGLTGIGPVQQLVYFRRLLAAGVRPAHLLIEIHPAFLHQTPTWCETRAVDVRKLDLHDLAVLRRYAYEPVEFMRRWVACRLSPWHAYRVELIARLKATWTDATPRRDEQMLADTDAFGWSRYPVRPADEAERSRLGRLCAGLYASPLNDFAVSDTPAKAVAEMLELCRREHIDAALVLMPEGRTFSELYTPRAQRRLNDYLAQVRRTECVPVFDCRRWCDDEQFCDGQHLLPEGAAAFTARLRERHLSPWLATRTRATSEVSRRRKPTGR